MDISEAAALISLEQERVKELLGVVKVVSEF